MLKNYFRIIAVVVFVIGTVLLITAYTKQPIRPGSFVVSYVTTIESQDAQNGMRALSIITVSADGRWRDVEWGAARKLVQVADKNDVYRVDFEGQVLQYAGPNDASSLPSPFWREATRTEMIAGIKAYVFRTETPDGYAESAYAPEMGRHTLRWSVSKEEAHLRQTTEAVSVQFRPVDDVEVAVPHLPIKFDEVEADMEAMRKGGALSPDFESAVQSAKARLKPE